MSNTRSTQGTQTRMKPDFTYLKVLSTPQCTDLITWKLALSDSIIRFAGIQGQSAPVDIMWVDSTASDVFPDSNIGIIRCPSGEEAKIVEAAVGSASKTDQRFRVINKSSYLPMLLS